MLEKGDVFKESANTHNNLNSGQKINIKTISTN